MDKNYDKLTKAEMIQLIEKIETDNQNIIDDLRRQIKESIQSTKVEQSEKNKIKQELLSLQQTFSSQEDIVKSRDEAIKREYDLRKEKDKIEREKEQNEKVSKEIIREWENKFNFIQAKFNDLAVLFDEYSVAFKDQAKLNEVIVRNNKITLELLESKIMRFNGSVPDTEKEK
jgi:hypothetical protein